MRGSFTLGSDVTRNSMSQRTGVAGADVEKYQFICVLNVPKIGRLVSSFAGSKRLRVIMMRQVCSSSDFDPEDDMISHLIGLPSEPDS